MTPVRPAVSRLERFGRIDSTQSVVRGWLAALTPEVCVAVADEQSAGRGRLERHWEAGPGQALLVSAGFRPPSLAPEHGWRIPALAGLAMLAAARAAVGGAAPLALKWPNDIVSLRDGIPRKLGGVLAEAVLGGGGVEAVIVGVGVNVDWPADEFPAQLAEGMSSLSEEAGQPVGRDALLDAWLARLLPAYAAFLEGTFDAAGWADAQATSGAELRIEAGADVLQGVGAGVDRESGALLLRPSDGGPVRAIAAGDVVRCRVRRLAADRRLHGPGRPADGARLSDDV